MLLKQSMKCGEVLKTGREEQDIQIRKYGDTQIAWVNWESD